jgi:hypothetical protein
MSLLEKDVCYYNSLGNIMLFGDTNARTGTENDLLDNNSFHLPSPFHSGNIGTFYKRKSKDSLCNARGRELIDLCLSANLVIVNGRTFGDYYGKATCFQYSGNSVVDYCLISDQIFEKVLFFQVEDHIPHLSDHAKLTLKLHAKFSDKSFSEYNLQDMPSAWQWKDASCIDFKLAFQSIEVKNKLDSFHSDSFTCVDDMVDKLNNIIYTVCNTCLKRKSPVKTKRKVAKKKWFDSDLNTMRKELIRRSLLYSKDPYNQRLKGSFFKYRKLYKKCCRKKFNIFKQSLITKLDNLYDNNPAEYWSLVKDLKEEGQEDDPAGKISSDVWVKHFTNLFNVKEDFQALDRKYQNLLHNIENKKSFTELDFRISEKEICKSINVLKNKKSAGLDSITNEMIKAGQNALISCLLKLFNTILSSGVYPSTWKVGYIKALFKSGDPNDPNNYRGISVMPCISKVFNSILNCRLQKFLDSGVINDVQIGFQPKSRTSDHMFVVRALIDKFFSQGAKLYALFVDFAKAFDSVIHSVLLYKLCSIGISGPFYNIIKSMYKNNLMHIKVEKKLTQTFCPNIGVRQGDNLSPNLFKLFINDLPSIFNSSDDQVSLNDVKFSCLLYADDLLLLSTTPSGLQNCINKLSLYCEYNGLTVNINKTKVITFCKSGRLSKDKYLYKGVEIEHVTTYKYLGIIFSSSGTFSYCQQDLYNRALKASFKISKIFGQLHHKVDSIIHLFDHTIKPILLYGSEIWATANVNSSLVKKADYTLLKSFGNMHCDKLHIKFLKYILGVNKKASNNAVVGELGRYPIYIDAICNTVKFYHRLVNGNVSKLLSAAFYESKSLFLDNRSSWVTSVSHVFKNLNISELCLFKKNISSGVKQKLVYLYKTNWCSNISECDGKLRTYAMFKQRFCRESYFNILGDRNIRTFFTKFRISAHKLNIETGRYKKIPADLRFCNLCSFNLVEDEPHFSMCCHRFEAERNRFFDQIKYLNSNFETLTSVQKFVWLMSSEDCDVVNSFASFLYNIYNKRTDLLEKSC